MPEWMAPLLVGLKTYFLNIVFSGTGTTSDWSFCHRSRPCSYKQGDCDSDRDCAGSLTCGRNNCRDFWPNAHRAADCCTSGELFLLKPSRLAFLSIQVTKTGSKPPRSQFSLKRRLFPYVYRLFHLYDPSQYLSSFPINCPKRKKLVFHLFLCPPAKKYLVATCLLNFDATDLPQRGIHIVNLNRCPYTPKFSGVT